MTKHLTVDGSELVVPYTPGQLEIFFDYDERYLVLPKGRRFGATNGVANFAIENLIEGHNGLWVDTVQANLDKYFSRYFYPILRKIKPEYWRYRTQYKDLKIINGTLDMRSAEKPQNIEGFAYDFIIINEAGIVLKGQKGRDLWFNTIRPMALDFKANVYFVGTPKGKKAKKDEGEAKTTLYYELALKGGLEDPDHNHLLKNHTDKVPDILARKQAEDDAVVAEVLHKKDPKWRTVEVTSYDNPLIDPEEIQEMEDDVPRITRAQEIYGKFIDIGDEEVFHPEWFNVVHELPAGHLRRRKIISLDTAFKKGAENDDSAGICVEEYMINNVMHYFITDMFCKKLEFPELVKEADKFYIKQNTASPVSTTLIEDKASGTPLIQTFRRDFPYPVKPITPITDKFNRAVAVTPFFEGGKVHLLFGWWNQMLIDQLCGFNARLDTLDDIVDAVSQAFNYIKSSGTPRSAVQTRARKFKTTIFRGYD